MTKSPVHNSNKTKTNNDLVGNGLVDVYKEIGNKSDIVCTIPVENTMNNCGII